MFENSEPVKCQNPGCKSGKRALILLGDRFVCGECYTKFCRNKNSFINKVMDNILTE